MAEGAGAGSSLFAHIEDLQGDLPWGSLLDAGTGTHSVRWVSSIATDRWVAVTGATAHAVQVRDAVEAARRPQDRLIAANWADPELLKGERFDTVLADYLIGAVEGFAPYFQGAMFARLRALTARRFYLVGLEPYVTHDPATEAGRLVWEIGRFRDACLLLAGERPYREYPMGWVLDRMAEAGFKPIAARRFPIRYKARFVNSQIDMCAARIARLGDPALTSALTARGEELRARALAFAARKDGIRHGFDYVIAAEPG
ncbi:hypothetical protein OK349_02195 [Sphingomonas sp. BT-65]|uniref:hypothetical protein n=1 Tax=Sphingomonas sp. BT-65 TaxID=2989821 RepID=UPI0022361ADB|nr:hypothetical protein [Sphingomonas sp. BT-65]MCW4460501.1 hypothetical protein [Sphingomonas sp. BT-65]